MIFRKPGWMLMLCFVTVPMSTTHAGDSDGSDAGKSFHFEYQISPILAKLGCSAAECHGGATGQGGFKLSLFADNPRLDYEAITEELGGRRIDYAEPSNSLVLRKPSRNGVKHEGGRILRPDDSGYQEILKWIERGAPFTEGTSETLMGITMRPSSEGFSVIAEFQSGSTKIKRDVTHLALLDSSNEQVAEVDEFGKVEIKGPGEAWIFSRYGKFNARRSIREPFKTPVTYSEADHPLDRVWLEHLQQLSLKPAVRASDEILVRRVYLDLVGRPPSLYELSQFEQLPESDRISRVADQLIRTPEFDQVFGRHFAGFFEIPEQGKDPRNAGERNTRLRRMFQQAMTRKASVAEFTRTILMDPSGQESWKHFSDPRDRAEYVGRTMLGMRIGCARCHNHPLDRWTNEEHLRFSAYFSDPRPAPGGGMMAGRFFLPGSGKPVPPELLPLGNHRAPEDVKPDGTLAWFILDSGNPQFARNMVNRILGKLIGTPIVDLPDDHRITNPGVYEPMLDVLVEHFLDSETDFRKLVHFIVTSDLYAVSSFPPDEENVSGDPELRYLARRESRPLTPSQYKNAIEFVLGVSIDRPNLPDSPLAQQLYIMNSGLIQEGLNVPDNQVDAIFDFQPDPSQQLVEMYRLILSRDPRPGEVEAFLPLLKHSSSPRTDGKDLAYALLAGREFGSLR